jgi:hypothetical protein
MIWDFVVISASCIISVPLELMPTIKGKQLMNISGCTVCTGWSLVSMMLQIRVKIQDHKMQNQSTSKSFATIDDSASSEYRNTIEEFEFSSYE